MRIWTSCYKRWRRLSHMQREKRGRLRRSNIRRLMERKKTRSQMTLGEEGKRTRGRWQVPSYRLWKAHAAMSRKALWERDLQGGQAKSRQGRKLRRCRSRRRRSTVHSSGHLRRRHMGEQDRLDFDQRRRHRTKEHQHQQQHRKTNAILG